MDVEFAGAPGFEHGTDAGVLFVEQGSNLRRLLGGRSKNGADKGAVAGISVGCGDGGGGNRDATQEKENRQETHSWTN